MQKQKVIFVTPSFQSFVKNDIKILAEEYEVIVNHYDWSKKILAPVFMLMQFGAVLKHIVKVKFLIISFGGYWSFFPTLMGKLFGKPTYIILHGTDCAALPEINYGSLRKPLLKWFCKASYKMATALLPVSDSLVFNQNTYFKEKKILQGFKHFFPDIGTKHITIPNGLDNDFWERDPKIEKEANSFLSVFSTSQFLLKGGDIILETAIKFPHCKFYFAGLEKPNHLKQDIKNTIFLGRLNPHQLKEYYNKSQFYFQLSIFEGFGCALCEAMLCECIPIVSNVNQLPAIVGESGYILTERSPHLLEKIITSALNDDKKKILQKQARDLIVSNFTIENRKQKLLSFLK